MSLLLLAFWLGTEKQATGTPHPHNSGGFVTDGTPQDDDQHCVGVDLEKSRCYDARRPECFTGAEKSYAEMLQCWAPLLNLYPWEKQRMADNMYCESKGKENAYNGQYVGLLQLGAGYGTEDPAVEVYNAYHHFFAGDDAAHQGGQGYAAWVNPGVCR